VDPLGVDADRSNSGLETAHYQENFTSGDADRARARADFDEAWNIVKRGPMRLPLADILLYPARLFFHEKPCPWKSPQDDFVTGEKLITDCGYHRRYEKLATPSAPSLVKKQPPNTDHHEPG
jgi:hypothetical protein